ncbi:MAG: heavy-metal-associated domain-containing protein [Caldilineaceae bacterium]|nr:heavy-metal-associated domain-containing protein [Caldilineaceae bacterium]
MNTTSNTKIASETRPVVLPLYNLSCSGDAQTIERSIKAEPGVVEVYANPVSEKVYIKYEVALTNPDRLRAVLQQAGFWRKKSGVTCGHCK